MSPSLLAAFVATLVVFCAGDFVWLGHLAKGFYQAQIGPLLLHTPKWAAAAAFYPLYVAGIVFFCIEPSLAQGSWPRAAVTGALLGLLAYATYDLSNLATLKGWTLSFVIVDVLWGVAITAAASTAGYFAARAF
jgi:uncharacterized membrane protein